MRYALLVLLVVIGVGVGCAGPEKTPLGHDPNAISPGGCPWKCCERADGTMPCTTNCCNPNECPCPHAPKPS